MEMVYEFILKIVDDIVYSIVSFMTNTSEIMFILSVVWVALVTVGAVFLIKKCCEKINYQTMPKESMSHLLMMEYFERSNQKRQKNNGTKEFLIKVFKCYVINGILLVLVVSLPFIIAYF